MISNQAADALWNLDLGPIKTKLMHVESGEGWSQQRADMVEVEYKRFLHLMKIYPNEQLAPSVDTDIFWHYHILDTMKYAVDCETVFGYFLHHYPYVGMRGEDDEELRLQSGDRMRDLYELTFGVAYLRQAETVTVGDAVLQGAPNSGYCAAPAASFYCAAPAKPAAPGAAYCAAPAKPATVPANMAAYCAAPAAPAYCAAPAKPATVSANNAAYCAAPAGPAYCAAPAKPISLSVNNVAYCAAPASPAYCAAPAKPVSISANGAAYCAAPAGPAYCAAPAVTAYCAAPAKAATTLVKNVAYCAAPAKPAYCAAPARPARASANNPVYCAAPGVVAAARAADGLAFGKQEVSDLLAA